MSNPSNSSAPNPLARLERLLRIQMPGAPDADVKGAMEDIVQLTAAGSGASAVADASPASDEVTTRLAAIEGEIAAVKETIAALSSPTAEDPTVSQRLDAIDRAMIALQGDVSRLATASPSRPAAAPARAAAPPARPTA